MIARAKRTTPALTPAACYIRMSSDKQDRSPAQQRAEIAKLASREGCFIAPGLEFIDEGITGDSGPDQRPGFKAMLAAAAAGRFKVLLAYDQDRVGRFDSLDAGKWLAPIRDSGVRIVTVVQGHIDLESSGGRIIYTVNQEAKKAFLIEHAAKTLRGKLATAARGGRNGGVLAYGMDRGLFDAAGALVRRLAPGESVRLAGHIVRALPSTDEARVSAVRFLFGRYASAAVSFRALAGELATRGFPPPPSGEWNGAVVAGILRNPLYCGTARFGACSVAKYHCVRGGEIVAVNGNKGKRRTKPQEEWIPTPGAFQGIIPVAQFKRVQAQAAERSQAGAAAQGGLPALRARLLRTLRQGYDGAERRRRRPIRLHHLPPSRPAECHGVRQAHHRRGPYPGVAHPGLAGLLPRARPGGTG